MTTKVTVKYKPFSISLKLEFSGQPKVPDLNAHCICKEHVAKFEISMDDTMTVKIPHAFYYLKHEVAHLRLRQVLPQLKHVKERLNEGRKKKGNN